MSPEERIETFDRIIAARRKAATEQYRQWLQFVKAANAGLTAPRSRPTSPPSTNQAAARPAVAAMTPMFCGFEQRRIASYARQAILGIAQTPTEDLQLFTTDGRSTPHAARMMLNMAAVEIGPKSVDGNLVYRALRDLDAEMVPFSKTGHVVAAE